MNWLGAYQWLHTSVVEGVHENYLQWWWVWILLVSDFSTLFLLFKTRNISFLFPTQHASENKLFFFCFQTFLCPTDRLLLKYQIIQVQVFLLKVFQCTRTCRQVIELCIGFHWYAFLAHFNYKIKIHQLTLNQKKYWNFSKNKTMYCLRER